MIRQNAKICLWKFRCFLYISWRLRENQNQAKINKEKQQDEAVQQHLRELEKLMEWKLDVSKDIDALKNEIQTIFTSYIHIMETTFTPRHESIDNVLNIKLDEWTIDSNELCEQIFPDLTYLNEDVQTKVTNLKELIQSISIELESHRKLLNNLQLIWNSHVGRRKTNVAKQIESLSKLRNKIETNIEAKHIELIELISRMRHEDDDGELKSLRKLITKKISSIEKVLLDSQTKESSNIQTLITTNGNESIKFIEHCDQFREANKISVIESSVFNFQIDYEHFLQTKEPIIIQQIRIDVDKLVNMKNEVLETIQKYSHICEETLLKEATDWCTFELKNVSRAAMNRQEKIKEFSINAKDIFEIRYAELLIHKITMDRHERAINSRIDELFIKKDDFLAEQHNQEEVFKIKIDEILKNSNCFTIGEVELVFLKVYYSWKDTEEFLKTKQNYLFEIFEWKINYFRDLNNFYLQRIL